MVTPSRASRWPGVISNSSSTTAAVTTLAATAAQAPCATCRRRSTAPALARNAISAATMRMASNPSRSSSTNDCMKRFAPELRQQAGVNRVELVVPGTGSGPRAQGCEGVLELARERGISGAHVRLDLFEREIRFERDLVGLERHGGVELAAHGRERGGRRRCHVLLPLGGWDDAEERHQARD